MAEADPGSPALVLVDQEGGRVERIRDRVPRLPPARTFGDDPAGERRLAEEVTSQARALAELGVDVNLAPVCDVVQEGESGAIGDRSFGADPALVGRLAAAHVRATLRGGVLPCAKHFPGHGAARVDSHRELPRIAKSLDELERTDFPPFRAAVEAGVPMVMAGHLLCPAVSASPATLCRTWLGSVLRERLGFGGAVVSDDMEMGALAGLGTPGRGRGARRARRVRPPAVRPHAPARPRPRARREGPDRGRSPRAPGRGRGPAARAGGEAGRAAAGVRVPSIVD